MIVRGGKTPPTGAILDTNIYHHNVHPIWDTFLPDLRSVAIHYPLGKYRLKRYNYYIHCKLLGPLL
jgi:hypothetical protein